jgi:hypothetical protein
MILGNAAFEENNNAEMRFARQPQQQYMITNREMLGIKCIG